MTHSPRGWNKRGKMRKFISRYNNIPQGLFILGCVASATLFAIIFTNVILRYIFSKPFHWAEEAGGLLLLFLTFAAAAEILKREYHISSDMVYRLFQAKLKRRVDFFIDACVMVATAIICWQAFEATALALRLELNLPSLMGTHLAIPYGFICLGSAFLALQAIVRIIERTLSK